LTLGGESAWEEDVSRVLRRLVLLFLLIAPAWAADPVYFADPKLKAVVERQLWVSDPTAEDMLALTSLPAESQGITDLTGLEYAPNLEKLWIRWNNISDLSPLAGLTNLEFLDAHANDLISDVSPLYGLVHLRTLILRYTEVSDISPLSGLASLEHLHLEFDQIRDISALSSLTNLQEVSLQYNQIRDISALSSLTHLCSLNLRGNPLNEDACTMYVPQIQANNPGIDLAYNSCSPHYVTFSSTAGGAIVEPGEGEFTYENGEVVLVRAVADPGFRFIGFSGTYATVQNPIFLSIEQNHQISADFVSVLSTIRVDGDAPNDPQPGDPTGSDPREDGTADHPFDRIQKAIELAAPGATIVVHPGAYRESIDFLGKPIELTGIDPNDPTAAYPILEAVGVDPVVRFTNGEDANSVLQGFVITGGNARLGAAVVCSGSSPTIANCLIVGNRATDSAGAVVYCVNSGAVFINCTITGNDGGREGTGLSLTNSPITVADSILWGNTPRGVLSTVAWPSISYSDLAGGWPGTGNIDADPLFAAPGYWTDRNHSGVIVEPNFYNAVWVMGDYHTQSEAGRWDGTTGAWVKDNVTSPCVNGGDPSAQIGAEAAPNGGIVNMGAYGSTAQASKSPAEQFNSGK
jgi:hypothetical protein